MYFDMALCQKRDFSCDSSEKGDGIAKSSLHDQWQSEAVQQLCCPAVQ